MIEGTCVSCTKTVSHVNPQYIQRFDDPYDSLDKIYPYLPYLEHDSSESAIQYDNVEGALSSVDFRVLQTVYEQKKPGLKAIITPISAEKKGLLREFLGPLRYRCPSISATTLASGQIQLETLPRPMLPRACPRELRRMQYLRCSVEIPDAYYSTGAFVAALLRELPAWQEISSQNVLFQNRAVGSWTLCFLYFYQQANAYPAILQRASGALGARIGDFEYVDKMQQYEQYRLDISGCKSGSHLKEVITNLKHFKPRYQTVAPTAKTTHSEFEIAVRLIAKDFKTASQLIAISAYETLANYLIQLPLQDAFRFVQNAVKSKYGKFGTTGAVLREAQSAYDQLIGELWERTDQMLFYKILNNSMADKLQALAAFGINAIMNEFLDALRRMQVAPLYQKQGERYVAVDASSDWSSLYFPFIGQGYMYTFKPYFGGESFKILQQLLKKYQIDPNKMSQNYILPLCEFRLGHFYLKHVRIASFRGECATPVFHKLKDAEWEGKGHEKTIIVRFQAYFGDHLTEADVSSSIVQAGTAQPLIE